MPPTQADEYEAVGKEVLRKKLDSYTDTNRVVSFYMLGYPMKSPNDKMKVLGKLPDMGEEVSFKNFQDFEMRVKEVYKPGININLISDGFAFSDVLDIQDSTVEAYHEHCRDMSRNVSISWFNAKDFYPHSMSTREIREKLMTQFAPTREQMEQKILMDLDTNALFRGMIIFMKGDLAIHPFTSGNQLQQQARITAKQMMIRNEAYSKLVQSEFKDSIRLSMHQSVNNGTKFAFQLIPGKGASRSPWHSSLFIDEEEENNQFFTLHREDAEKQGLHLVYNESRPYYFTR